MNQSAVLKYIYDYLTQSISKLGSDTSLFSVENFDKITKDTDIPQKAVIVLGVTDLVQIRQDLNGEKIVIDETRVAAPTHMGFIIAITAMSINYSMMLEASGIIVQYLKDNNAIDVAEYNWHGNTGSSFFIEPIIRSPTIGKEITGCKIPFLTLEYRIEAAINSQKSEKFKRVKELDIRGLPIEDSVSRDI